MAEPTGTMDPGPTGTTRTSTASGDRSVTNRTTDGTATILGIALALTIIGGINWGLVGLFNFDLVAAILGPMSTAARAVYVVVGIAAVVSLGCYGRLRMRSYSAS